MRVPPIPTDSSAKASPRSFASQLPAARRVLSWVYVGRMVLIIALFVQSSGAPDVDPAIHALVVWMLPITAFITAICFWYTHRANGPASEPYLYGQLIFDALLLTLAVQVTGASESPFAPLYILLISVAALLLSTRGGILVGLFAIVLYLGSSVWGGGLELAVIRQIGLFVLVALVTGYLGGRLRAAGAALGAALGEVQTELAQLRLDTGDILNTMNTGVLTVDGEGCLVYINPAAEELLGLPAEQWVGSPVLDRLDRAASGLGEVIARSARERIGIRRFETKPLTEESYVLGVSTTLVDRLEDGGSVVTAIFQDITEKKRVEALRRRAERLEAVAGLSASLAHEIKNPLASIRSAVEQIAEGKVDREDDQLLKNLVVRESDRLSRLLTDFIDFARVKVIQPEPVDFLSLVQGVIDLTRSHPDARGRTIELVVDGAAEHMWIRGAGDLLHRAVFNLLLNAVQWAGEGGTVKLSLDAVRSDLLSPALGALSLNRLTVTDTGPGVPEALLDHIFDPFFTGRPGGTGLGLALVQRAVEAHAGAIFVDNGPPDSGVGATFTLYLPALLHEAAASATSSDQGFQPL